MKWHVQSTSVLKKLEDLKQVLLSNRQINNEAKFFNGLSPFKISLEELKIDSNELRKIKKRLQKAKKNQEKVIIFGDYDADGITATAVLWQVLRAQHYNVLPFIPNRLKHGYGLSTRALEDLLLAHADTSLIITVDNGIVAHEALQFLKTKKIEVIISDHHQMDDRKPNALAVFHSSEVCGCAVAWFLARELSGQNQDELLTNLLALVAIATVTDLMPLVSYNRFLLMAGLVVLKSNLNLGLKHLFAVAKIDPQKIDAYTLGFQIGPRINAMGRLADGMDALRLLCTNDQAKAVTLSNLLKTTNEDRQTLTLDLTKQAELIVANEKTEKIIFLSSRNYHEGIIGLIAGKMTEKFSKPSIVISEGNKISKASARSLPGFNITQFIRLFKQDLLEVGGHPLAAGFALRTSKIEAVKRLMQEKAQEILANQNLEKIILVDAVLESNLLDLKTALLIEKFAPFGMSNQKPSFILRNAVIRNYQSLGKLQEHLKLWVTFGQASQEYELLAWNRSDLKDLYKIGDLIDLVVNLEINNFRGNGKLQLILKDLCFAKN